MRVEELPVPAYLVEKLQGMGVRDLYPPQEEAVRKGLLEGRSLLVATPTASGKTLLAALAASKHLENKGKVLYLTPLRALASEKREYFGALFGDRYRVTAVSRDFDQPEEWLRGYDIIVATNEKMDSMLRHRAQWIYSTSLVVVDEVHTLSAAERGSTLEVVVTRLKELQAQLLLLSATVKNVEEIASFSEATPVVSNWRPVPLREAVYVHERGELYFTDGSSERVPRLSADAVKNLVLNTVSEGGQAMVFAGSRRAAELMARDVAEALRVTVKNAERLRQLAEEVYDGGDFSTRLAYCIRSGVAFHHAGLAFNQRAAVERGFREGGIRVIVATPTLAAGVNMPARTVIIPDLKRAGEPMSVMEYKQLAGRAGRPGYDREGMAVIIASNRMKNVYMAKYILGEPEPIRSSLPEQGRLRFHMLGLVSSGIATDDDLSALIRRTLAVRQDSSLPDKMLSALEYLESAKFIKRVDGGWAPTKLGRRVAELYIDPMTARIIFSSLDDVEAGGAAAEDVALLTISSTPDVESLPHLQPALDWFIEYEGFDEGAMAKASVLKAWINEMGESTIGDRFRAAPGDIYVLTDSASWVAQAASELAVMVGKKTASRLYMILAERIRHGVREELLPLVWLPGVGRVRARALYNAGLRRLEDIKQAGYERLAAIPLIGPSLARNIMEVVAGNG